MNSKVRIEGGIYSHQYEWDDNPTFHFFAGPLNDGMKEHGYAPVVSYTMEFTLPDGFDPRNIQIEVLRAEIQKTRAEARSRVTTLEERISKLLAIEHKPTAEPAE